MNILFDIGHPGQVHLLKYIISKLSGKHKVIVTVKDIPSAINLLKAYNIPFLSLGEKFDSILLKGLSQIRYNLNLLQIARKYDIDLAVGSSITITHISCIHKLNSIVLDDDDAEAVKLFYLFAHPFADCIISPSALDHQRENAKGLTYRGTHELFYLHPKYFKPDPCVLGLAGLTKNDRFFVVRFVSGKAYHDKNEKWMTISQKKELIEVLLSKGKVLITSENKEIPEYSDLHLRIPPEKIHDLMYYADMFVGDSQTMTSEAAILGTPAIKCNTFAHRLSVPNMLENKYDLCYSFHPSEFNLMVAKMKELLNDSHLKSKWQIKKETFINDCIDPTSFLCWFIENWPHSKKILKNNPEYQNKFKY